VVANEQPVVKLLDIRGHAIGAAHQLGRAEIDEFLRVPRAKDRMVDNHLDALSAGSAGRLGPFRRSLSLSGNGRGGKPSQLYAAHPWPADARSTNRLPGWP